MLYLDIKQTPTMGRGVFAAKDFNPDEIIEICPAIPIPKTEAAILQKTIVEYWLFEWETWEDSAMILGYGMIYNHSTNPNAAYKINFDEKTVTFTALRLISKGEEIFIKYDQDYQQSEIEMLDANTGNVIKI